MSRTLLDLVEAFRGVRLLVVGDLILDGYLRGRATKLCAEAPAPVVSVSGSIHQPGGAGNCAHNVRALGGRVELLSVVGVDEDGHTLLELLGQAGVGTALVEPSAERRTLAKRRVTASSQVLVRLDQGSAEPIRGALEARLIERLEAVAGDVDGIIVSDYGCGVLTQRAVTALARLQARAPALVLVDARDLGRYRSVAPTAVKPNYQEAAALVGGRADLEGSDARAVWAATNAHVILERSGSRLAAVTLDSEGAVLVERGRPAHRTYARPVRADRAIGAGDTFAAAFALALAAGADGPAAAELASAAAAVVVSEDSTAVCGRASLLERIGGASKRIDDVARVESLADEHRRLGRRLVFTNGCFDILHRGHVAYLNQAKALGDVLIVGLNSDESVRRLKGPGRPINALADRAEVLGALSCVDHVVPFGADTPEGLIRAIRPHLFVKGADYTRERLPEATLVESLGGAVRLLPYLHDRSTTAVIDQIRRSESRVGAGG